MIVMGDKEFKELKKEIRRATKIYISFWLVMCFILFF